MFKGKASQTCAMAHMGKKATGQWSANDSGKHFMAHYEWVENGGQVLVWINVRD